MLAIAFSIFLMVLSLYFLFVQKRLHVKPKPVIGVACGVLSGFSAGLFAVGGPPMALYFLSATEGRPSYLACMQLLFTVTGIANLSGRVINHLLHPSILPSAAVGTIFILSGGWLGGKMVSHVDIDRFCKIVYLFVGISGIAFLLQSILPA